MKRLICILLALSLLLAATGCAGRAGETGGGITETGANSDAAGPSEPSAAGTIQPENTSAAETSAQSGASSENSGTKKEELLQSASVDLDMDGNNEEVEVLQAEAEDPEKPGTVELEGILRITGINGTTNTVFIKKTKGFTGVMNTVEFEDIDGDGAKDVFISIPEAGASFSLNYYYIYNYKNGSSYKFNVDAALSDFAGSFKFAYEGKGILRMTNQSYGFTAGFDITDKANGNGLDDEMNREYERAWVDPSPVVISEASKIALQKTGKEMLIKVPLPVFGLAAADMIGEVDMYFSVGKDFTPVMRKFEVFDFTDDMSLKKIGVWEHP